ncbi:MAG TPA: zinc-binding dehydrogenase, partial [Kofleriaceae bacterium]
GVKDGKRNIPRVLWAVLRTPRLRILKMFERNIGIYALNALPILRDDRWIRRLTEQVATASAMNITPHVGKIFPASEAPAAHAYLETRQALGKVLLEW